jgi:hypothetical protein
VKGNICIIIYLACSLGFWGGLVALEIFERKLYKIISKAPPLNAERELAAAHQHPIFFLRQWRVLRLALREKSRINVEGVECLNKIILVLIFVGASIVCVVGMIFFGHLIC